MKKQLMMITFLFVRKTPHNIKWKHFFLLGECTSFVLRLATKARSKALGPLHPSFDISRILRDVLDSILPDNAHEIVKGRLYVSLTRVSDRQPVLVSEFHSKADLIQVVFVNINNNNK